MFKTIGVIGFLDNDLVNETVGRLTQFLRQSGREVLIEESTHGQSPGAGRTASRNEIGANCDLVIVVGGDGSMLGAASALARYNVPLLGVNQGRLGFLTDIRPEDIEILVGEVLSGKYLMETRFMLELSVMRNGNCVGTGEALNDVVLHPGKFIRMIEFELYIDEQFVYNQRSDGLIVSTPTGSTAYALSAGGPLVHPRMDAVVLVPMNPHTLSSRSIVVDGSSEIKLLIGAHNSAFPHVTCDGQSHVVTEPGDEIHVHKHPWKLNLIHPLNHNFYESCRSKLGWQTHRTN